MLTKANHEWLKRILLYIGDEYYRCLYLYMDFIKYRFDNEFVSTWIDVNEFDQIVAVILKYHTGMHIFSKDLNYNKAETIQLIMSEKPTMICAQGSIVRDISSFLLYYDATYGYVGQVKKVNTPYNFEARKAKEEDLSKLATLMCDDDGLGKSYSVDAMLTQLKERYEDKYSRNVIIFRGKDMASHVGTGAEVDKIAIINGVITDAKYRGQGLAGSLVGTVAQDLLDEGKKVFSVYYTKAAAGMHHKVGFTDICEWGKLELSNKKSE